MLYATTRSKVETFTAQRALRDRRSPDGGCFVPVQMPLYTQKEIFALKEQSPGEAIAQVMNRFFGTDVSGRDVEFVLGKNLLRQEDMNHRIVVAELWRNSEGSFQRTVRLLNQRFSVELGARQPGEWIQVVCRIAFLFAVYGELQRKGVTDPRYVLDIAVESGDFSDAIAAWYARQMGLPVGTIVVCCTGDGGIWDLLSRGQMRVNGSECETSLERLLFAVLGRPDVERFVEQCEKGGTFVLNPEKQRLIQEKMFASVVSQRREFQTMRSIYRTKDCILHPDVAVAYAGLQDYRAVSGLNHAALLISRESPVNCLDDVKQALGIDEQELRRQLKLL